MAEVGPFDEAEHVVPCFAQGPKGEGTEEELAGGVGAREAGCRGRKKGVEEEG